jgi:hypothetical protein
MFDQLLIFATVAGVIAGVSVFALAWIVVHFYF